MVAAAGVQPRYTDDYIGKLAVVGMAAAAAAVGKRFGAGKTNLEFDLVVEGRCVVVVVDLMGFAEPAASRLRAFAARAHLMM